MIAARLRASRIRGPQGRLPEQTAQGFIESAALRTGRLSPRKARLFLYFSRRQDCPVALPPGRLIRFDYESSTSRFSRHDNRGLSRCFFSHIFAVGRADYCITGDALPLELMMKLRDSRDRDGFFSRFDGRSACLLMADIRSHYAGANNNSRHTISITAGCRRSQFISRLIRPLLFISMLSLAFAIVSAFMNTFSVLAIFDTNMVMTGNF